MTSVLSTANKERSGVGARVEKVSLVSESKVSPSPQSVKSMRSGGVEVATVGYQASFEDAPHSCAQWWLIKKLVRKLGGSLQTHPTPRCLLFFPPMLTVRPRSLCLSS